MIITLQYYVCVYNIFSTNFSIILYFKVEILLHNNLLTYAAKIHIFLTFLLIL